MIIKLTKSNRRFKNKYDKDILLNSLDDKLPDILLETIHIFFELDKSKIP